MQNTLNGSLLDQVRLLPIKLHLAGVGEVAEDLGAELGQEGERVALQEERGEQRERREARDFRHGAEEIVRKIQRFETVQLFQTMGALQFVIAQHQLTNVAHHAVQAPRRADAVESQVQHPETIAGVHM
eukprot:TRINITY_DN6466_c0_g1_i1.p2 TRINITY_DN6466_c0_g1~~TRINITY_DN6466_c0_g1_i1.p2  ORF type:complete len:129 (+),score=24.91 TRINITY_DN6466_c0_g1_i1:77-463(+)